MPKYRYKFQIGNHEIEIKAENDLEAVKSLKDIIQVLAEIVQEDNNTENYDESK